jgi:hypothetical protein
MQKVIQLTLRLTIVTSVTGVFLLLPKAEMKESGIFQLNGIESANAQFSIPADGGKRVYDILPNFPLENQYVNKETGKVDTNNTLVSRLLRYHILVKSRPPSYRFDWKLTLADYLEAHQYLVESQYPGANILRENPMESDRAVIKKLNRAQRDALVNALVSLFQRNSTETPATKPNSSPQPTSNPTPIPRPSNNPRRGLSLPQPGDSQLLKP